MERFRAENPSDSDHVKQALNEFCSVLRSNDNKVAVVTSGGTTVPLEKNCVRFVDNFSGGTRGALSAEELLKAGYSVIFLSRQSSLQPFIRQLPALKQASDICTLLESDSNNTLQLHHQLRKDFEEKWPMMRDSIACSQLLTVHFSTVFEYLAYLETIACGLGEFGSRVMFYLAAAVSDYYIPWPEVPEHKIQSRSGQLVLKMENVPKCLGLLRHEWAPSAFHISFKLETDEALLMTKSKQAIQNYGVHCVVANMLHTRTQRVHLVSKVSPNLPQTEAQGSFEVNTIDRQDHNCIEEPLIRAVISLHSNHVSMPS